MALRPSLLLDARTGKTIWSTAPGGFTSTPAPCPGDVTAVCATGTFNGLASGTDFPFDVATGTPRAPIVFGASISGRDLGGGLFDSALRNPDVLVAASGSRVSWRKPLASIFGAGSTTDTGWAFTRDTKRGLFVGSVGFQPLKETKTTGTFDLSKAATAGFRIRDGSLVWRNPGASDNCGICVGLSEPGYIVQTHPLPVSAVGVRVREIGRLVVTVSALSSLFRLTHE